MAQDICDVKPDAQRYDKVTKQEWWALKHLSVNKLLIIKEADKEDNVVIRPVEQNVAEVGRQLNK